jgi:hypothetical protein
MKIIEFYKKDVYGNTLEYVKDETDAMLIRRLIGKKTIDSTIRELIYDLTAGRVAFKQVMN